MTTPRPAGSGPTLLETLLETVCETVCETVRAVGPAAALYGAKASGRNRVGMAPTSRHP